jgi:hypothetical protein
MILTPPPWSWTSCGRSYSKRPGNALVWLALCRARARWWLTPSATAVKLLAEDYGNASAEAYRGGCFYSDFFLGKRIGMSSRLSSTWRGRQRQRRDGARRTMEQYLAPAAWTLRTQEFIVFQVGGDARGLIAALCAQLQPRPSLPWLIHYPKTILFGTQEQSLPQMYGLMSLGRSLLHRASTEGDLSASSPKV